MRGPQILLCLLLALSSNGVRAQDESCEKLIRYFLTDSDRFGMTDAEIKAIYWYTARSANYQQVNSALRAHANEKSALAAMPGEARARYRHMLSGLKKLPDFQARAYRGFSLPPNDPFFSLKAGGTFDDGAFISASASEDAAIRYMRATGPTPSMPVLLDFAPGSGKHIVKFSSIQNDDEVLFPPKTRFRIEEIMQDHEKFRNPLDPSKPIVGKPFTRVLLREI